MVEFIEVLCGRKGDNEMSDLAHGNPNYLERWRAYRISRNRGLAVVITWMISISIFTTLIDAGTIAQVLFTVLWFVSAHFLLKRTEYYANPGMLKCPRCEKPFFYDPQRPFHNFLAKKCMNCGLPKWAKDDPDNKIAKGNQNEQGTL